MKKASRDPINRDKATGNSSEFGRAADLQRLFGIRRGTAYNLLAAGKIQGCLLRVTGKKSGVRLFHIGSVRNYIRSQMGEREEQNE
jgi:hypothetical protein